MSVIWRIGIAIDAFVQARRQNAVPLAAYNRPFVYIAAVAATILLSLALSPFRQIETFSIENDSNLPTLQQHDRVIAYSVAPGDLARGDMVILHLPRDPKISYVKRIVGLPGERVRTRQGLVLIDDVPLHRSETESSAATSSTSSRTFVEITPEGKGYLVLDGVQNSTFDTMQEQRVPEGHYWVLGDNRDNSLDSRAMFQVGFVPAQNIYRKVAYIYWSRDRSRIGMAVE